MHSFLSVKANTTKTLEIAMNSTPTVYIALPSETELLKNGSKRQVSPVIGNGEKSDIQIVGVVSDLALKAEDMGK